MVISISLAGQITYYLMKTLELFSSKIVRHTTPWNTWKNKATRNVYKPNKYKVKNYCKITPGIWKTWHSYSIFGGYLQCFTKVRRLPKTWKCYLKYITNDFSHELTDLFLEVIASSDRLRLSEMEIPMTSSTLCSFFFFPLQTYTCIV